jgi:hypothetical protein
MKPQTLITLLTSILMVIVSGCFPLIRYDPPQPTVSPQPTIDPISSQCLEAITTAKLQIKAASKKIGNEIEYNHRKNGIAFASIPTLSELRRAIEDAKIVSSSYQCKQMVYRENLESYILAAEDHYQNMSQSSNKNVQDNIDILRKAIQ